MCGFLGRHLRLGVELDLWLPATATQDLSCLCDLHHSSQQCWIFNPLSEARDLTHILVVTSKVCNPLCYNRNSKEKPIVLTTEHNWILSPV